MDETLTRLYADLEKARSEYTAAVPVKNRDEVRVLSDAVIEATKAISRYVVEGAADCPDGTRPLGLVQPQMGKIPYAFEIGCPSCPPVNGFDIRTFGVTREEAVTRFNDKKWTPIRKPVG